MTGESKDSAVKWAQQRVRECEIEAQAFRQRLNFLSWSNWITVVAPALLSAFAGASVFGTAQISADWKLWTGGASLLSALLVAVHKGRNCDAYQAECRRLIQSYESLATRYRTIAQLAVEDAAKKLADLDDEMASVRKSANVDVPDSYRAGAAKVVDARPATASV